MALKPIQRVTMPDRETLFREYAYKRQPVIITDIFAGQPIREVTTIEKARRAFGCVSVNCQQEYASQAAASTPKGGQPMTLNAYLDHVDANPDSRLMCTEDEIPARVMSLFTLPDLCKSTDVGKGEILDLPRRYGDHDLLPNVFIANKKNFAHMHFDADQRQVFLYQVFGRKRVILFSPSSGRHLNPTGSLTGFSGVFLEHMSDDEQQAVVDAADGWYDTIHPGEAVFIPMLMWHYLEYTDTGMSFNIRFGRNKYGRFLCVDNFHRDYYIQNFASLLAETDSVPSRYGSQVDRIVDEYVRPAASLTEKVQGVRRVFREVCADACADARLDEYCRPENEAQEVAKIVKEITPTMRYAHPDALMRMRPTGPMSAVQRRQLLENTVRHGYTPDVLAHLLGNRVGKSDIDSLTQADAAQFFAYMRASGATW